jgi:CRISPR-associated protein Cmr6
VSRLPLPPKVAACFAPGAALNLALRFERGMDGYDDEQWRFAKPAGGEGDQGKSAFLAAYAGLFNSAPREEFDGFVARRGAALGQLGFPVEAVEVTTRSRLVIGLGLPHPTETGLLLDRLIGSPYLPGSSLKGALRATARWIAAGELEPGQGEGEAEEPQGFWQRHLDRLFGPAIDGETTPAAGSAVFFDAFPTSWPRLEVDVLVPHHGAWNGGGDEPPADWENPVPVAFLTVAPRVSFRIHFGVHGDAAEVDLAQLHRLVEPALGLLGIGGKRSSGYGVLAAKRPRGGKVAVTGAAAAAAAVAAAGAPGRADRQAVADSARAGEGKGAAAVPRRKVGDKVRVEVIAAEEGAFTLRDLETGQDDIVLKAMVPWALGERRRVRVEKVSPEGRVLKVRT